MKTFSRSLKIVLLFSAVGAFAFQTTEAEKMKTDLVGKKMGGREKAWKFQSVSQIKQLVIDSKTEEAERKVYEVRLTLQDPRVPGKYEAKARIVYKKVDNEWQLAVVGLMEMKRIE